MAIEGLAMLRQRSRSPDETAAESAGSEPRLAVETEVVRVRNYDHRTGHSVHVTLDGLDVDAQLTDRSYLAPGQSTSVSGAVDPGRYQLQLRVDGVERRRADLELDGPPAGVAVVELGNGAVSVTRGV